jgi:hypothetical protein
MKLNSSVMLELRIINSIIIELMDIRKWLQNKTVLVKMNDIIVEDSQLFWLILRFTGEKPLHEGWSSYDNLSWVLVITARSSSENFLYILYENSIPRVTAPPLCTWGNESVFTIYPLVILRLSKFFPTVYSKLIMEFRLTWFTHI